MFVFLVIAFGAGAAGCATCAADCVDHATIHLRGVHLTATQYQLEVTFDGFVQRATCRPSAAPVACTGSGITMHDSEFLIEATGTPSSVHIVVSLAGASKTFDVAPRYREVEVCREDCRVAEEWLDISL